MPKPFGYWKDFRNVKRELEPIIEKLDEFPTQKQLYEIRRGDIVSAMQDHHGGISTVRKRMGYELKRKPVGYWEDFENLKRELEPIIEELGDFPTLSQLKKIKRWDIERAINNHHDGINFVRKKMGFKLKRKPKGYWQDFENVRKELELIIEELGEFPSQNQLKKMGRSSLATAIHKYHGGFPALRKRMSYELKRKPDGYWEDFENLKKELEPILEKLGEFPTCSQLRKMGRSDIGYAIHKYHGGFPALRERMGYKPIGTKEELLRFVEEHEESKKLLTLGLSHFRYLKDAIDILTRLFPKRIDPNKTMEIIDSSIEPLRAYLGGFEVTKTYDCIPLEFLESIPPSLFKIKEFESLLFDVAQDSYQKDFNKDPRGTIETLKTQIKRIDNPIVRRLLKRVLKFYKEVLYYDIPGIKPLVDKRGEKVIK